MKNAQTQEVPWSVVPSIERLASGLIPQKHLLTTCTHDLNYVIRWCPTPESAIEQFLVLELPGIHQTNVFLHILVGHELFHPLLEDFFNENSPSVMARLKEPCKSLLHGSGSTRHPLDDHRLDSVVECARHIWRKANEQVGASSVDVRLGHQFIILRRAAVTHVDPTDQKELGEQIQRSQQKIRVSLHHKFIIHPGQLALGATLEYLSMPTHLTATVEGRSSWGRLGLIIATACNIEPGFKGCITLELVNNGEAPLVLYPGVRIAQFVFHRAKPNAQRDEGKYNYPVGPQFSLIDKDEEMPFWGKPPLRIEIRKPSPQEYLQVRLPHVAAHKT